LSLDRTVSTTLELVDEDGIGAATMREVSSRLGVRSMSLYRYVRDRDELLDAVVERIGELVDPADEIDARRFPTPHRLAAGLAQDQREQEFETGLAHMLDRVGSFVADVPSLGRG
jgi:AcrR family transcriptional regulator